MAYALWACFVILAFGLCRSLHRAIGYRLALSKAGCSKPIKFRHWDPIFGLDLFIMRAKAARRGESLATDKKIFNTYGKTVQTNDWGTREILTMDSQNIQAVLTQHVDKFGAAPRNNAVCQPLLGDGIITTDGALWKRSRQLINPIFARAQVAELSSFEVHVRRLMNLIPGNGSTVDMQPLLQRLFLDSSTEFIFGESANSLSPEASSLLARRLLPVFTEALRVMRTRFMMGKFRFLRGRDRKWRKDCAEVHAIIDEYVDKEIARQNDCTKREPLTQSPYSYVLLNELVKMTDDRRHIRNELINIFFPGHDSSAILTGNAIFLLARNPDVWCKLRAEVLSLGQQKLTFELLKSMKYMRGVINEVLRVLSPVSRSWKTCLATCSLPRGGGPSGLKPILLQPGDLVNMAFSSMHVDTAIWGPDAAVFRPERWDDLRQSWDYIPFLGGRRICPAQQNVLTEVAYVLVRLMQEFQACENRDPCLKYVEEFVFTKQSANGVMVAFTPA